MFWLGACLALVIVIGLAAARRWRASRKREEPTVSPLSHQHFEHFQGEELDAALLERITSELRHSLLHLPAATVAERIRPDNEFLYKSDALASIGSDQAGLVLAHLLEKKLGTDPMERAWILHDLIRGLKSLHRVESLGPLMLQTSVIPKDNPLVYYCAVELISFPGFSRLLLGRPTDRDRKLGWQILRFALDGFRFGVHSRLLSDCRLGDLLEQLLEHPGMAEDPDFLVSTASAVRLARRSPLLRRQIEGDEHEIEALTWQIGKIEAVEQTLDFDSPKVRKNLTRMALSGDDFWREKALRAISELRLDTGNELVSLLKDNHRGDLPLVFEALGFARGDRVLPELLGFLAKNQGLVMAGETTGPTKNSQADPNTRDAICAILELLKRHPGKQAEMILTTCCSLANPKIRKSAISSLGWWEPLDRPKVLGILRKAVSDTKSEIRWAAKAALARLGERKSLNFLRQLLCSEDISKVHMGIQMVGNEGISLLWPDLDHLMDSDDEQISYHAWEATEILGTQTDSDGLHRN